MESSLIAVLLYYYQLILSGDTRPEVLRDYAVVESLLAGVDPYVVTTVINRESGFDTLAINRNDNGEGCHSRGLVQIRSCNHKTSDKEAYNPIYAVNFLISNIDKCKTWWRATCPIDG